MNIDQLITALVQQGGFALLAAAAIFVCYKQANLRAQDLSLAMDREREARSSLEELHRATLQQLTVLCGEVQALKMGVNGLLDDARTGRLDDTWPGRRKRPAT